MRIKKQIRKPISVLPIVDKTESHNTQEIIAKSANVSKGKVACGFIAGLSTVDKAAFAFQHGGSIFTMLLQLSINESQSIDCIIFFTKNHVNAFGCTTKEYLSCFIFCV